MKTAYLIHARDKEHLKPWLECSVRSAFAQDYTGELEIVLSDQGSRDGTRWCMQKLADSYAGPHTVRVVDCPETGYRGMAGLNEHVAWLMKTIEADCYVLSSADDYAEPERVRLSVEALENSGADMVGTAMYFQEPGSTERLTRTSYQAEGWASVEAIVMQKIGGSCAMTWRRELWERAQPTPMVSGYDVYLPPIAAALGGFWFVNRPLHTYVRHKDPRNMGLEGRIAGLPETERRPLVEHQHFEVGSAYDWVYRTYERLGIGHPVDHQIVAQAAHARHQAWIEVRTEMSLAREAPVALAI